MPVLKGAVTADGALVAVSVAVSSNDALALRAALKPVPPPVDAQALLDSGAEVTCLDTSLVQTLALPWAGTALANVPSAGGLSAANQYEIRLTVVHPAGDVRLNLVVRNLLVLELAIGVLGYQILIGRDVLNKCRFLYDGPRDRFLLSY